MRRLGQHFLTDDIVLKKIVAAADPQANETIVEIGPGHGELTRYLLGACRERDCRVVAIEKDRILAQKIGEDDALEVIAGDALKILPTLTPRLPPYKIVGNIPYYITGKLLRTIGELMAKPKRCVFTLQKEVALRLAAEPPRMNRLAASVQFWAELRIVASVLRAAFRPAPDVDSAVVNLETRVEDLGIRSDNYYKAVRALFKQPRKTVLNNLAASLGKEKALKTLRATGVDERARPQDLTIQKITEIAKQWG